MTFLLLIVPSSLAQKGIPSSSSSSSLDLFESLVDVEHSEEVDEKSVIKMMGGTITGSSLVYGIAVLRKVILKHSSQARQEDHKGKPAKKKPWLWFIPQGDELVLDFSHVEYLIPRLSEEGKGLLHKTKIEVAEFIMRNRITPEKVAEFIELNRDIIYEDESGQIMVKKPNEEVKGARVPKIYDDLIKARDAGTRVSIVHFDDFGQDSEIVHAIAINEKTKRITLVFRGSVTDQDWKENLKLRTTPVTNVVSKMKSKFLTEEDMEDIISNVRLHNGFADYLFGELPPNEEDKAHLDSNCKFDRIAATLEYIYTMDTDEGGNLKYSDYRLCVTGHSLGAALAQLAGFALASSKRCRSFIPSTIYLVSYASPNVGTTEYLDAMQKLQGEKIIYHLRITSQGDVVPVGLASLNWYYKHQGLNLHVKEGEEMEVLGSGDNKTLPNQLNLNAVACHSMESYQKHLFGEKANPEPWQKANLELLSNNSFEELYEGLGKSGSDAKASEARVDL